MNKLSANDVPSPFTARRGQLNRALSKKAANHSLQRPSRENWGSLLRALRSHVFTTPREDHLKSNPPEPRIPLILPVPPRPLVRERHRDQILRELVAQFGR